MSNKRYSLSTISKEIRAHITIENKRAFQQNYNSYVHCFSCTKNHICPECPSARKFKLCKRCSICNAFCDFYEKEPCSKSSPSTCATDMKIAAHALYYYADYANQKYLETLSSSKKCFSFSEAELQRLDQILTPLLKQG